MIDHRGLPLAITLSPGQAWDKAAVVELRATHPHRATWSRTRAMMPAPSSI